MKECMYVHRWPQLALVSLKVHVRMYVLMQDESEELDAYVKLLSGKEEKKDSKVIQP
jgi:hypothetical protein